MANDFWGDDVEVCVRHQGKIAVYDNTKGCVVIRQPLEGSSSDYEDQVIFVEPENVDALVQALLQVKEALLQSTEES